jgi:ribonuclease HI
MKQREIFENIVVKSDVKKKKDVLHQWTLFVDGASKNNPGPSGAGIFIEKNSVLEIKCGYYLGIKTNNQAEYFALLFGLLILAEHVGPQDAVSIISDSKLLVSQLNGKYKVKHPNLQPLYAVCKERLMKFDATIAHVLRHENVEADAMANYGVKNKIHPPKKYIAMLHDHGITL